MKIGYAVERFVYCVRNSVQSAHIEPLLIGNRGGSHCKSNIIAFVADYLFYLLVFLRIGFLQPYILKTFGHFFIAKTHGKRHVNFIGKITNSFLLWST